MKNKLLNRRQFVVDVIHPNRASVSRSDLKTELAKKYRVKDPRTIILFGFRNAFGGGRSSGFGLIYDDFNDAIRVEPQYRLHRVRIFCTYMYNQEIEDIYIYICLSLQIFFFFKGNIFFFDRL